MITNPLTVETMQQLVIKPRRRSIALGAGKIRTHENNLKNYLNS